jgi:ABC-type branched-subunit amino acid transport system substrate-binding protein
MSTDVQQPPEDQVPTGMSRKPPEDQVRAGGSQEAIGTGQWLVFFIMIFFFIMAAMLWVIAVFPLGIVAILTAFVAVPGTIVGFFQLDYFKKPGERAFEIIGNYIENKSLGLLARLKDMFQLQEPVSPQKPVATQQPAPPQKPVATQEPVLPQEPVAMQEQVSFERPTPSQKLVAPPENDSGRELLEAMRRKVPWGKIWAAISILIVASLLFELVPTIPRLIPHPPTFCAGILNGPTISYQLPTQEPVGISGDASCFDFEQQNNDQSDDVEQLIYAENKEAVPDTSLPHITEIVAVSLTGNDSSSRSEGKVVLRGALIAQKEYNQTARSKHLPPLRLLVANDGTNARYASTLAKQIVQLANSDPTILGVVGWPFSTLTTEDALTTLEQAHISSISPTLSSNEFTGAYTYFFRVAPPDIQQGTDGARFAKAQWNPHKVAIFVDYGNPYSRSLAMSFAAALEVSGTKIYFVQYTRDEGNGVVPGLVQKALGYGPDLVYFAGYANDFDPIRGNLYALQPHMPVMGGDGLYQLGGYQQNDSNFQNLYFTTFASTYSSTDQQGRTIQEPQPFSTEYSRTFDRLQEYPTAIDYSIAESDSILAYDVTKALLTAYLRANHKLEQREAIHQALQMMNDDGGNAQGAIQGASGRISFGLDGNPEDKVIYMLHADASHNVCIAAVYGTYQEGATGQPGPKPNCAVNDI